MEWKKDKDGNVVMQDGNPVLVHDDGKEVPLEPKSTFENIGNLTRKLAEAEKKAGESGNYAKLFDGIEKPEKFMSEAKKALEKIKSLSDGELISAGKVEELKAQLQAQYGAEKQSLSEALEKLKAEAEGTAKAKDQQIFNLLVTSEFARSKALSEKTIFDPKLASTIFGRNFKVQEVNGELKPVAFLNDQPVMSKKTPGSYAEFDEAFTELWDRYPDRQRYSKPLPGGSGASGGSGADSTGNITLTRDQAKNVQTYRAAQEQAAKTGGSVVIQ